MTRVKWNKSNQQGADLSHNEQETSSHNLSILLPSLALAIIGLLLASVLIWRAQSTQQQEQYAALLTTWGTAYTAAINQRLALIQSDTKSAAAEPGLAQALQANEPHSKRQAERHVLHRPAVVEAYLKPFGEVIQDHQRDVPINFAALDLLRRAETGAQPLPEALQIGTRWLLYSAAKLDSANSPGSLLMVYDLARVLSGLPQFTNMQLQVTLQQQFANAPAQRLYSLGSPPSHALSQSFSTQHPNWTLIINAPAYMQGASSSRFTLLIALVLALLSIISALYMLHNSLQHRLKADALLLKKILKDWIQGKSIQPFAFNLNLLQHAIQPLTKNAQRFNTAQQQTNTASNLDAVETVVLSSSALDSLYQTPETDILDIDILDEEHNVSALDPRARGSKTVTAAQDVPSDIFRAYDIRGIVGKSLTLDTAYWIGRAVGSESIANGEPNVVVGRDGRLSGPGMAQALMQGLLDGGCSVTDLGMVPTPTLYFATHVLEARSGVMVTGSHNPPDYNGFKIVIAGETLADQRISDLHTRIINNDLSNGTGRVTPVEMLPRYLSHIRDSIHLTRPLRVVVDCGNGVGGVVGPQLLEALGCTVIPLYCDVDGHFPNHHPDPGKAENLQELIARVKAEQADIGIAFDGDADRLGVVTNSGRIIYSDHLMMLFAKDVLSRNPGADVIFDVKCSRRLAAVISDNGGNPIMWKTGHSLMKAKMKETGALLAGEMSGHVFFKERWFGFDDGIYSAARLLEILSKDSRDADAIFASFPVNLSTPEITIEVTEDTKFKIIERLQHHGQWGDASLMILDGVRADFANSWGLVRASNTTPMLVLRFEGETTEDLEQIKTLFREQLLAIVPDLDIPF